MHVFLSHIGSFDPDQQHRRLDWPEGMPIPSVGAELYVPGLPAIERVLVVQWHPYGNGAPGNPSETTPFVYIVVGPAEEEREIFP